MTDSVVIGYNAAVPPPGAAGCRICAAGIGINILYVFFSITLVIRRLDLYFVIYFISLTS